ncbi:hypothetical protein MMC30_005109 [Trapelia coarctata]|nr:hypothetical protein [Trapelia coarctata]
MGARSWYCEPMKHCDDRQGPLFLGEVLGGTSRINAMVYTRGSVADYDAWSAMGHPEWSYEKVLPYFIKGESTLNRPKSKYRGDSGPWINQAFTYLSFPFQAYHMAQQGAEALGFSLIDDPNLPDALCDGMATLDSTVDQNKQRVSTLEAFLPRATALKRAKNLTICTGVIVSQIKFSGDQVEHRAERVHFQSANPKSEKVFSAKVKGEVIISSGAIGSPQVLMLSGIGPRQHLEKHGIEVVRDLPGVGSELCDHVAIPVAWEVPVVESLTHLATSPLKVALEFFKYVFFRTGILSIPVLILTLFVRGSSLDDETSNFIHEIPSKTSKTDDNISVPRSQDYLPDIELMPLATSAVDNLEEHKLRFAKIGVFSLLATLLRPRSRGTVRLGSSNPHDRPKVDFGFMSDPADFAMARKAIRLALKLGAVMKAQGFPLVRGLTVPKSEKDDEEIDKLIRHRARTTYHYSSTCRMAPEFDAQAPGVVDDSLRVHGVSNLRVCDASVFPQIVSSHLQAPVVMVAEKCADMIKGG